MRMDAFFNLLAKAFTLILLMLAIHPTTSSALQYNYDYSYKGGNFAEIKWYGEPWGDDWINTSDSITIEIRSEAPLPSSLNYNQIQSDVHFFSIRGGALRYETDPRDSVGRGPWGWSITLDPISGLPINWNIQFGSNYTIWSSSNFDYVSCRGEHGDGYMGWAQSGSWSLEITTDPPAVPEPSTLFLLGTGLVGLIFIRRRGFPRGHTTY
ncbi:hypothetical protein GMST_04970 [Geomonas silvestris]|uniref:Ice-binding protein C-terminal domain-containing protein n=1 Tax=Geomonas silvestris TaxID=2740184 RepID=A0A6V8MDY3_9BACT|nr:PEP-CTERM sorting domain-containing protein [Geomonas silvestris]GFO58172.1 hypothetical protein GMST_04970 [Geomonas silvestris]